MINELVKKRAQFASALTAKPDDYYAKKRIAEIDREMSSWAESKNIPGRFTGRTGARVLSVDELAPSDPRYNAWARKVCQFNSVSRKVAKSNSCNCFHFAFFNSLKKAK